ncbi:MAG: hypothetical protein ACRCT5_08290 [Tannerellaceae bacterium]
MKTICHVRENFFSLLSRFGYKRTKKYKEAHKRTITYKDVNVALGLRYICNVIKQAMILNLNP